MSQVAPKPLEEYRDYLRLLARLGISPRLRGRIDASDAVQHTLLMAHAHRDQFRGATEQEYRGWLRKILANHLTDLSRQAGRREGVEAPAADDPQEAAPGDRGGEPPDNDPSPPDQVAAAERLLLLANALERLPSDQAEAIELHHIQELSVCDVAQRMGKTAAAVAGLLRRGTASLRSDIGDESWA